MWMPCSPGVQSSGSAMDTNGVKRETLRVQKKSEMDGNDGDL